VADNKKTVISCENPVNIDKFINGSSLNALKRIAFELIDIFIIDESPRRRIERIGINLSAIIGK
tara:strand:- start:42 stop:233 length:192 start_codon:yes stop_codon:yes gene_type:complete